MTSNTSTGSGNDINFGARSKQVLTLEAQEIAQMKATAHQRPLLLAIPQDAYLPFWVLRLLCLTEGRENLKEIQIAPMQVSAALQLESETTYPVVGFVNQVFGLFGVNLPAGAIETLLQDNKKISSDSEGTPEWIFKNAFQLNFKQFYPLTLLANTLTVWAHIKGQVAGEQLIRVYRKATKACVFPAHNIIAAQVTDAVAPNTVIADPSNVTVNGVIFCGTGRGHDPYRANGTVNRIPANYRVRVIDANSRNAFALMEAIEKGILYPAAIGLKTRTEEAALGLTIETAKVEAELQSLQSTVMMNDPRPEYLKALADAASNLRKAQDFVRTAKAQVRTLSLTVYGPRTTAQVDTNDFGQAEEGTQAAGARSTQAAGSRA